MRELIDLSVLLLTYWFITNVELQEAIINWLNGGA